MTHIVITGVELEADAILKALKIKPSHVAKKGDPLYGPESTSTRTYQHSLIQFNFDDVDLYDLPSQIACATSFLEKNLVELKSINGLFKIDDISIQFACKLPESPSELLFQENRFPSNLLRMCGEANIDICLSLYPRTES